MGVPVGMTWLLIIGGVLGAYFYLHKDADVEQRIDKREAIHARESASIDRDFARLTGDKAGQDDAEKRIAEAKEQAEAASKARAERAKNDQRGAVRAGIDDFLKPENKGGTK